MKNLLRKILFGDITITEYSTITVGGNIKESVFLKTGYDMVDVSTRQWLLCLDPIVFGIWEEKGKAVLQKSKQKRFELHFKTMSGKSKKQNTVATIVLDFFDKIDEESGSLFLLKLNQCTIYHANIIKTRLLYQRYYKKPGLSFQKLKSFVAAYSYPRRVRLVSFTQDDYYNIFPMDLLGVIPSSNYYVFGLRHTNIALSKIIENGKIVVSEISHEYKDTIYKLGKHHSVAPPSVASLPFHVEPSESFRFYLPEWVNSYREINIKRTMNLGSHMLLWGEWINEKKLKPPTGHLYHIHFLLYLHQISQGAYYPLV